MRKRNIKKQIWIDVQEDNLLKKKSKESGLSESEFIRSLVKGYRVKARANWRNYYRNYEFKENKVYIVKVYEGIKIDSKILRTSSFYRLYVHFLYVLGKLPPKVHYEERTPEYYKEIDRFRKLCDELNMIGDYSLTSIDDTKNLRTKYIERVLPLKAQREQYRK